MTAITTADALDVSALIAAAQHHREYADSTGRLHRDVWAELQHTGITAACLPHSLGGSQTPVVALIAAIAALAKADASAGWAAGIHGPAGIFTALLPAEAARGLPAATTILVGGSSQPGGIARQTPSGWLLSGRWPLVTGARQVTTAFLAARLIGSDDTERGLRWWCVPRAALTVEGDWDAHGLRGTDSATVTVTDLLLPLEHSVDLSAAADPGSDPLYRFPRYGLLACGLAAVAIGVADRALDDFHQLATAGRPGGTRLADQPAASTAVADTTARLGAAHLYLEHAIDQAWTAAIDGLVPHQLRAALRLACGEAVRAAGDVARLLFDAAGSAAVYRTAGLGDRIRDLDVIAKHALLGGPGRVKTGTYLLTGACPKDL